MRWVITDFLPSSPAQVRVEERYQEQGNEGCDGESADLGPEVPKVTSFVKIIGIEEHFLSPAIRASWATSASAGQDASESLNSSNLS
jgi:hypothetical protein